MSRKKETTTMLTDEENDHVHHLFAHYHQLADTLHSSMNQTEAEDALTPVNMLAEAVQVALFKMLAQENHTDAADILSAVNMLSPDKESRKEARRGLIRLEATKTYPQWKPSIAQASAIQANVSHAPRFWKGWVTQTREEGEMHLVLSWEQGYDYSEARLLIFVLDYWEDGVEDCVVEIDSKRHIDESMERLRTELVDRPIVDCTPAEGKRLLQEALSVNMWHGKLPHSNYRNNLPLINKLLLQNTTDLGEDHDRTFINHELEDQEVSINFLGAWSMGDYGLAYDLLAHNSAGRDEISREKWIVQHRAWFDEAHPTRMELGFVHERERSQSALWLPPSSIGGRSSTHKEIEVGWSLELSDTPLSGTLKEMPLGTAINKDTGRRWFWTSYTLVREQDAWRIQHITDEGAHAQGLPIIQLQQRIKEQEEAIEQRFQQRETDPQQFVEEVSWRLTQLLHYSDALIALLPLDEHVLDEAYQHSIITGNPERIQIYLERRAQRFPNNRVDALRRLGAILTSLAYRYDNPEMQARRQHLLSRAEDMLKQAVATDQSASSHTVLGELFLSQGWNDEAESEFHKAQEASPAQAEQATIEAGLGNIAMRREHVEEAIPHYQHVIEINQTYPGIWFSLGFAHRQLGHFAEAEASYQHAIQVEPTDIRPYSEIIAIAMKQGDKQKAREIAEQSVIVNPDSAPLHAILASVLFEVGDQRAAQQQLAEAESIDPQQRIVQSVRQHLSTAKKK